MVVGGSPTFPHVRLAIHVLAAIRGMVGRPTDAERNLGIEFCLHAIGNYSSGMCQVGFKMKNPFDCVADSRLLRPPWAKITPPSPPHLPSSLSSGVAQLGCLEPPSQHFITCSAPNSHN